jgi:hypothetical protein
MIGTFERPFCSGPSCRKISYGPDCIDEYTPKKTRRRIERRQWMREYLEDEFDFWELRSQAGWLFLSSRSPYWKKRYGDAYAEAYEEFGVTPSGVPVRRGP